MNTEIITINGLDIQLIRSKRKTLSLEVGHSGVKARAPLRLAKRIIIEFIISKQHWLENQRHCRPSPIEKTVLQHGTKLLLHDKPLTLQIIENQRGSISYNDSILSLPVIQSRRPLAESIKDKLIRWYKNQALAQLQQRVDYYSTHMNVERPKDDHLRVREYKRRWGSCDHRGGLSFNWRIIMAPPQVLDYVVIHELAHCHEFNHSRRFWALVAQQMPHWKEPHDWLQLNGTTLYTF